MWTCRVRRREGRFSREKAYELPNMSKVKFLSNPAWAREFMIWCRIYVPELHGLTEEFLRLDVVLAPASVGSKDIPYREGVRLMQALVNSSDPDIQRLIQDSTESYRLQKFEDNFKDEATYRSHYGGLRQLGGLAGKINLRTYDPYMLFTNSSVYAHLLRGGVPEHPDAASPPPVPPFPTRKGAQGGGDQDGPPPLPPWPKGAGKAQGQAQEQAPPQAPKVPPARPKRQVLLADRQDPRRTERLVLEEVKAGRPVPPELLKRLGQKVGKGQTKTRGREVTDTTEEESLGLVANLQPDEAKIVTAAAKDYSNDSAQINKLARGQVQDDASGNVKGKLDKIDSMFEILESYGMTDKSRVVYRISTYTKGTPLPYGKEIGEGDFITDKGYISTSENRQLLNKKNLETYKKTDRLVRFTLIGSGGANISAQSPHTNETYKQLAAIEKKKPGAGQAEILFRRNTCFQIQKIDLKGRDVHVTAIKTDPPPNVVPKDSFTGQALPLG